MYEEELIKIGIIQNIIQLKSRCSQFDHMIILYDCFAFLIICLVGNSTKIIDWFLYYLDVK